MTIQTRFFAQDASAWERYGRLAEPTWKPKGRRGCRLCEHTGRNISICDANGRCDTHSTLCRNGTWAGDLLPLDRWIVSTPEPVPSEAAPRLKLRGKLRASVGARASILRTPDLGCGTPFVGAAIENSKTSSWHRNIELSAADIRPRICGLHDHLLARNARASERELIALTARRARRRDGSKSIGQVVGDSP